MKQVNRAFRFSQQACALGAILLSLMLFSIAGGRPAAQGTVTVPPAQPGYSSDAAIQRAILWIFQNDRRLLPPLPLVDVRGGFVTLYGRVTNMRAFQAAEADALSIAGIRGFRNLIRVRPGVVLGDGIIMENVRRALASDSAIAHDLINISVQNGVVTLSGSVNSEYARWRAGRDAAMQRGVLAINNLLNASDIWAARSDGEIEDGIEQSLHRDATFRDGDVHVQVIDGNARLTGLVNSRRAYERATEIAYEGGARTVDNDLRIQNGSVMQGWRQDGGAQNH